MLDAAFRQGYNLAYGCREGQCSACKCYLLDGEVELKRYSSFALSDTERSSGYALMCRAMPEQDLVVELLHYDPDNYRLEHPISDGVAVVEAVEDAHRTTSSGWCCAPSTASTSRRGSTSTSTSGRRGRAALVLDGQPPRRRTGSS